MTALDFARLRLEQGFGVFPLATGAKTPLTEHGFKDACRELNGLVPHLEAGGNYGIVWPASDPAVVFLWDVDGEGWEARLDDLEDLLGDLPPTIVQATPSGGRHLVFRWPADVPRPTGGTLLGWIVRWPERGYIVGAGSVVNGIEYLDVGEREIGTLPRAWALAGAEAAPPADAPVGDDWTWTPDMGSRHDLLRAQVLRWRRDGVTGDILRALAWEWLARHGMDGDHDGRRIEAEEVERLCAGAEEDFAESAPGFTLVDDEPPAVREEVPVTGFGFRVSEGHRGVLVRPGTDYVVVSAYIGGEPAVIRGSAAITRLGDRKILAGHLADIEGKRNSLQDWLRLIERAIVLIESATPITWHSGLGTDEEEDVEEIRVVDLVSAGVDTALVGLRSRLKTITATAAEIGLVTNKTVDPAFPVATGVEVAIRLSFESSVERIRKVARRICRGASTDPAVLDDRWYVIRAASWEGGVEAVIDLIRQRNPATVHLTIDSIQKALGSIRTPSAGDQWGGPVETFFAGIDRIRGETRHPDMSCLILDHAKRTQDAKGQGPADPNVDTMEEFRKLRVYGSQRKEDGYRASARVGVLSRGEDGSVAWVERISGALKPPEDDAPHPDKVVRVIFGREEDQTAFAQSREVRDQYPRSIIKGTKAAELYDDLVEHGPSTVAEIVNRIDFGGKDQRDNDNRCRHYFSVHKAAFHQVPGTDPIRWEIVPRGLWVLTDEGAE